jgi:hypothetical protein
MKIASGELPKRVVSKQISVVMVTNADRSRSAEDQQGVTSGEKLARNRAGKL